MSRDAEPIRRYRDVLARHQIRHEDRGNIRSVRRASHVAYIHIVRICRMLCEAVVIQAVCNRILSGAAGDFRFKDQEAAGVVRDDRVRLAHRQRRTVAGNVVPARVHPNALARHIVRHDNVRGIQSVRRAVHVEHVAVIRACALQREAVVIQIVGITVASRTAAYDRLVDREALSVSIQRARRVLRRQRLVIPGCVSKVESMTAERKNFQNQKEIRAECRIFLYENQGFSQSGYAF